MDVAYIVGVADGWWIVVWDSYEDTSYCVANADSFAEILEYLESFDETFGFSEVRLVIE